MQIFTERGIQSGLSECSKRYAKCNNKYLDDYKPSDPTSYLMYFDINNYYGGIGRNIYFMGVSNS